VLFWITDLIIRQIQKVRNDIGLLKQSISAQARDATIDAAFLGVLGLLAALVFYMGTVDFLEAFSEENSHPSHDHSVTIRMLAVAAVSIVTRSPPVKSNPDRILAR
jgi:hypothetical protein